MQCGNIQCNNAIDAERLELLPRTRICSECAAASPDANKKLRGAMIYNHKTAGDLYIFNSDAEAELYRRTFRRVGQRSNLRTISPGIS